MMTNFSQSKLQIAQWTPLPVCGQLRMAQSGTLKCESTHELSGERKRGSREGEEREKGAGGRGGGEGLINLFDARTHLTPILVHIFL